ncbi:MAG: hypothetical protein ACRD3I_11670 [Terriglobales bacterium]
MNRLLVMLVSVVLGSALPGGAVAEGGRGSAAGVTQLILLFFSDVSRGLLPKRVVAEDKDWKIVKDAEQAQGDRKSQEERRREAYQRLEEQEREAREAREDYRREARNALRARFYAGDQKAVVGQEREDRRAHEERLRVAERRKNEMEWEAQKAKENYHREARKAREERRREAEGAYHGG